MSIRVTTTNAPSLVDKGTFNGLSSFLGAVEGANDLIVDNTIAPKIREALQKEGWQGEVVVEDGYFSSSRNILLLALGAGLGAAVVLLVRKL